MLAVGGAQAKGHCTSETQRTQSKMVGQASCCTLLVKPKPLKLNTSPYALKPNFGEGIARYEMQYFCVTAVKYV
jgi:hypothetical protein